MLLNAHESGIASDLHQRPSSTPRESGGREWKNRDYHRNYFECEVYSPCACSPPRIIQEVGSCDTWHSLASAGACILPGPKRNGAYRLSSLRPKQVVFQNAKNTDINDDKKNSSTFRGVSYSATLSQSRIKSICIVRLTRM